MKYVDYSPVQAATLDQQRDALKKGLGRAVQWAEAGRLDAEPLLAACLKDQRYDKQCEGMRGNWLWQMVETLDLKDGFRVPILHALYDLADGCSAFQLCEFAVHYAQDGDETFRDQLYEIVEARPLEDYAYLGEAEILELDKAKGFLFAARIRGQELANRSWEWDDTSLVDDAIELCGKDEINRRLNDLVATRTSRDGENRKW